MININNVISSKLLTDPWPHKVIKNFLSEESLSAALKIVEKLSQLDNDEIEETLWITDIIRITGLEKEAEIIVNAADRLIKNLDIVSTEFKEQLHSNLGYFNNPRFSITTEGSDDGEIHDEPNYKVMSLVVYLAPETSIGTLLYLENDENSFHHEVEWDVNSALMFYTIPNKTWHKYKTNDKRRFTLNFYFETLESLDPSRNSYNIERFLWLHDQFGQGKLIKTLK
jgi:hypothetical protein